MRLTNNREFSTHADSSVSLTEDGGVIFKKFYLPGTNIVDVVRIKQQYEQLLFLQELGINVPDKLELILDGSALLMEYIKASDLSEYVSQNKNNNRFLYRTVGYNIKTIHNAFFSKNDIPFNILTNNKDLNYHNAKNFFNWTCRWLENDFTKNSHDVVEKLFRTIIQRTKEKFEVVNDLLSETELIFGDLKPENMIFCENKNKLFLIDPMLSMGRQSCDIGKFLSRTLLTDVDNFNVNAQSFFEGYNQGYFEINEKNMELLAMTIFDLLNYISRQLLLEYQNRIVVDKKIFTFLLSDVFPVLLDKKRLYE